MSTSLYNTFGNEVKYRYNQGVLTAYLENSTINFPLPEASSEILAEIAVPAGTPIDSATLEAVQSRLIRIGFKRKNANAMASVLIAVAEVQGISPMSYFSMNENTLQLTLDAYESVNALRPKGNKIDLKQPIVNSSTPDGKFIKP
tara:strand:- start:3006 stop:3440 length:435 start_codon:yes stop_codon:yes gene_type:complete